MTVPGSRPGRQNLIRGASAQLAAQISVAAAQFTYAGVNARILPAEQFGAFVLALSLYGVVNAAASTGIPSFVLRAIEVDRGQARRLRLMGIAVGIGSALLVAGLMPTWSSLLGAPLATKYQWSLAGAALLTSCASVESALLRRQKRPVADAACFGAAYLIAAVIGAVVLLWTREMWSLAVAPLAGAALQAAFAATAQRALPDLPGPKAKVRLPGAFAHVRKVSVQSLGFVIITQIPLWVVSSYSTTEAVGYFSRALSLAGLPALAISTALSRTLQSEWSSLSEHAYAERLSITLRLALTAGLPVFAALGALGVPLIDLWLGAGWRPAGELLLPLALASGFTMTFAVAANAAEQRGAFRSVRMAQLAMALILTIFAISLAMAVPVRSAVWLLTGQGAAALMALALSESNRLSRSLGVRSTMTIGIGMAVAVGVAATVTFTLSGHGTDNADISLAAAIAAAAACWAAGVYLVLRRLRLRVEK